MSGEGYGAAGAQQGAPYVVGGGAEDGGETVPAHKYEKLKKKFLETVESRDDVSLALFRAQKLIHRLREDKSSLLDRVVQLESAAGLTSRDVSITRDQTLRAERELAFPLLHPPAGPSLADRAPKPTPAGPAPSPETFPPRQKSHHLRTAIAAQKLRDDRDAQLAAHGLSRPTFPAVAVLGLEGSIVALNVERALAGQPLEDFGVQEQQPQRGNKRRRESSTAPSAPPAGGRSGRGTRAASSIPPASAATPTDAPPPPSAPGSNLPNPFAAIGAAIPLGTSMHRNNADVLAASSAPVAASIAVSTLPPPALLPPAPKANIYRDDDDDAAMEDLSDGFDPGAEDEEESYKPKAKRGGGRKSEGGGGVMKPKKVKAHGVTTQTHYIAPIGRNGDGSIRLPVTVGMSVVSQLGTVDQREGFSTERYIFPVGYEATRRYFSMIDPSGSADYTCRVIDGGDGQPRFELHPSDQPGVVITAGTATGVWSQVLKAANKVKQRQHSGGISGPDQFGFSSNAIKALIQELPGAREVKGYVWQNFVEDASIAPAGEGGKKAAAPRKGAAGGAMRVSGRRGGRGQTSEVEASPAPPDTTYDYNVNDEYDPPSAAGSVYGDYTPAGSPGATYAANDYSATSLQHLLDASSALPVDPYAIPEASNVDVGAYDPFLAVAEAANAAAAQPFDPYAIAPSPPRNGIDPAFGTGYQGGNAFAYDAGSYANSANGSE